MIVKHFKRRSSATEVLKQIGVPVRDYNLFIENDEDEVVCKIELAQQHVAKLSEQTSKQPSFPTAPLIKKSAVATKSAKDTKPTKAIKAKTRTVTSVARELITAGKTNDEVWSVIQEEFNLDDTKRSYPAWYRRDCKKRGLIT